MSAQVLVGVALTERQLGIAADAVEMLRNALMASARRDGVSVDPAVDELLAVLRDGCALTRATQAAQVARVREAAEWAPTDLITVAEAAKLHGTTQSNIRGRCRKGSMWSTKRGRDFLLSRANVLADGKD